MRNVILLIVFGLIFSSAYSQSIPCFFSIDTAKILADANLQSFIDSLQVTELRTQNKKSRIPRFIRRELDCWTKGFDIANPGKKYQSTDIIESIIPLPKRQLIYLGLNNRYMILTYRKGGFYAGTRILLFKFKNKTISDFWISESGNGDSKEAILNYLIHHHRPRLHSFHIDL